MKPGPREDRLKPRQLVAARALAHGATQVQVHRKFNIPPMTLNHWLDSPKFRAEIRKHIDLVMAEKVVETAHKALDVIYARAEKLDPENDKHFDRAVVIWDKMQGAIKRLGVAGQEDTSGKTQTLNITFTTKDGEPPRTIDALYKVKEPEDGDGDEKDEEGGEEDTE